MSAERFALDTNVLVYVVDDGAGEKQDRAREVFTLAAASPRCVLATQCVGEFYAAATRKRLVAPDVAAQRARDLMRLLPTIDPIAIDAEAALDAAASGRFAYWDALLLTTLGRVGCTTLLSEDMQDGAGLAGVTVLNPFAGQALPKRVATVLG